jgi:DNA modification methylase
MSEMYEYGNVRLVHDNCFEWLLTQPRQSVHAVVTDPPYGVVEYTDRELAKLRCGIGGVWRQPPTIGGSRRAPLPRFTDLTPRQLARLDDFFATWAQLTRRVLVPGAHLMIACTPLLAPRIATAIAGSGLDYRGTIVRRLQTMRGGDRPKNADREFPDVSVMPRSQHEPWLLFREPLEGRVQDNLRAWKTGGLRRISDRQPFGDVIRSAPTHRTERRLAPHENLKPQAFLRQVVRAALPLGEGIILDPFAGSGSTLAAAHAVGYQAVGVERDLRYFQMACEAIPRLAQFRPKPPAD